MKMYRVTDEDIRRLYDSMDTGVENDVIYQNKVQEWEDTLKNNTHELYVDNIPYIWTEKIKKFRELNLPEIVCKGNEQGCFQDSPAHNCGCPGLKEFAERKDKKHG